MTMEIRATRADFEERLDQLQDLPDWRHVLPLEVALEEAFAQTQADVDVITGSLKGSGRTSSDIDDTTDTWVGEITYGGDSPGFPNDPVDYAGYERARGGGHDYFRNLHAMQARFHQAIREVLRDDD